MLRRSVRVSLVVLTVALSAAAVWRATTNEQARGRMRTTAQQEDGAVAEAIFALADLRASFYAALAPGQGDYWWTQSREQIDALRTRLLDIDAESTAAGFPLAPSLDRLDRLDEAATRARRLVASDRTLEAAPVAFTEARELIEAVVKDLSLSRQYLARAAAAREAGMANEQSLMAGGVIAVWIVTLIMLVPVPRAPATPPPADTGAATPAPAAASMLGAALREDLAGRADVRQAAPDATPVSDRPLAMTPRERAAVAPASLAALAALCGDLGRVDDAADLPPLLARTADLLGAGGLVIWLLDEDGRRLLPAVAHGYDEGLLARMGGLGIDEQNLTATAFRTGAPTFTAAAADHAAAVAVPIITSSGPSGVMAAELASGDRETTTALAGVVAAQLANLFPAPPADA